MREKTINFKNNYKGMLLDLEGVIYERNTLETEEINQRTDQYEQRKGGQLRKIIQEDGDYLKC